MFYLDVLYSPLLIPLPSSIFLSLCSAAQIPVKRRQSKTSAAVIEAHIVAVSLPVRICLRPVLISASGPVMSARIHMISLECP